jgi:uncharacterized repeat protein (TIGR03843 family)
MATFDLLVNNADRKGGHVLLDAEGSIWGCDHGLTFHVESKLRTVIWEFGGEQLPADWCADLQRLSTDLRAGSDLAERLQPLLSPAEIEVLALRAEAIVRMGALPDLDEEDRPYPWPPI